MLHLFQLLPYVHALLLSVFILYKTYKQTTTETKIIV